MQADIDVNCECTSIRDLLSWACSFVGFAEFSDAQIKVNWLSYAVMYLFFYPLQQLKLSLRYLGHISWRILLYTRIPLNLPNEVLESDSSLLTQFLKCRTLRSVQVVYRIGYLLLFFADFSTTLFFFIQSLGFTLRESWQKFEQRSR